MEIFSRPSFVILVIVASLVPCMSMNGAAANSKVYGRNPDFRSGSGESVQSSWEENKKAAREPPIEASTCPTESAILPCECLESSHGIRIWCEVPEVNQTSVENVFGELRRVNGIPEDRGVDIYWFLLGSTELTQFDLAPLYGSRMDVLYIENHDNLTKLVTSGNPQDHRSIHVNEFHLSDLRINGEELGDTLKYFSAEMTTFESWNLVLNNNNNNNNENSDEAELVPGLSAFVNLDYLRLVNCNVGGRLTSSHFTAFPTLASISLWNNKIDEIGENVFPSHVLYIDLRGNKLNETSFHPNSGIASNQTGSGKHLALNDNQFTTLPSQIFQTFLDAHPENSLYLMGNPLTCDERLSWLKSRREEFQSRVNDADCSNDEGF